MAAPMQKQVRAQGNVPCSPHSHPCVSGLLTSWFPLRIWKWFGSSNLSEKKSRITSILKEPRSTKSPLNRSGGKKKKNARRKEKKNDAEQQQQGQNWKKTCKQKLLAPLRARKTPQRRSQRWCKFQHCPAPLPPELAGAS